MKFTIVIIAFITLFSCNPTITKEIIAERHSTTEENLIRLIQLEEKLPKEGQLLGTIEFKDSGLAKNCNKKDVIKQAIKECQRVGANTLQIIQERYTGFKSECYGIKANFYYIDYSNLENISEHNINNETEYILSFFRPDAYFAALKKFKIYDEKGNLILILRTGERKIFKTNKKTIEFFANKPDKNKVKFELNENKKYLILCKIEQGWASNKYIMELLD
jgi:hypothetical protein